MNMDGGKQNVHKKEKDNKNNSLTKPGIGNPRVIIVVTIIVIIIIRLIVVVIITIIIIL